MDPYSFSVNWYGTKQPIAYITQNPPLACYYIALVSYLVGWNETGIHIAFLIPAIAAIIGTFALARRFCHNALLAGLVALLTPVFLVSSTTVMCDVLMLTFWIWALVLWMHGLDKNSHPAFALSAILISAGALTKYYALALVPLLLVYSLVRTRRLGWWIAYFLVPITALAAYQHITDALYGHSLLSQAASYAFIMRSNMNMGPAIRLLVGLAFAGGCFIPVLFFAPWLWSRKALIVGIVLVAAIGVIVSNIQAIGCTPLQTADGPRFGLIAQLSVFTVCGIGLFALAFSDILKWQDADSLLLCLWIGATIVFAGFVNWTINGRSILPAVPAMGILLVRRLELQHKSGAMASRHAIWALIPAGLLALAVTHADYALARSAKLMALRLPTYATSNRRLWFNGHWGFQYYALSHGVKMADSVGCLPVPGDTVVLALGNAGLRLRHGSLSQSEIVDVPIDPWISTLSSGSGAGFHCCELGPLPYVIGCIAPEQYSVLTIIEPTRLDCPP